MKTPPTVFVILGATGDLTQRKLIPAILDLSVRGYMPKEYRIVGFSRREFTNDDFRTFLKEAIKKKVHNHDQELIDALIDKTSFTEGSFEALDDYEKLAENLVAIDEEFDVCSNKLFYLAVPPKYYGIILENLAHSGLTMPCSPQEGWTRVLIEKPFGSDTKSARELDKKLGLLFKEEQVFRIDHYLAKETLQNILMFRFSNALFEPVWGSRFIEKVEILLHESSGIEGRGALYDGVGALRDVGQNHVLQMLAYIAMERPEKISAESIRKSRANVLSALHIEEGGAVRGQYKGFKGEAGVDTNSETETFFRVTAFIENNRWKSVPFMLESGKELLETKTEIKIYFRDELKCLCPPDMHSSHQNVLTFRIQPNEGISVLFWAKKPGFQFELEPKHLSFLYDDSEEALTLPDAYERVLYDCIRGDQTLFASTEEVILSWKAITPVLEGWLNKPLLEYDKGSKVSDI